MRTLPALLLLAALGACGTPGQDLVVDVPPAPVLAASYPVGEEVGRLLSADPAASQAAEARLIALDGERRDLLLAHARTMPAERDLRWLHVLDEHHALPELPVDVLLDFLLWKAARPERPYAMKAQSRLLDMARTDPGPMTARVRDGAAGSEVLAVVLGIAGVRAAFPALLHLYRHAYAEDQRAAAAEALGMLRGGPRAPRATGHPEEIMREADALEAWYRDQLEIEADEAAAPAPEASR